MERGLNIVAKSLGVPLTAVTDIKASMLAFVATRRELIRTIHPEEVATLDALHAHLSEQPSASFPNVTASLNPKLSFRVFIIQYPFGERDNWNVMLAIDMPCAENMLLWMPYGPGQRQPEVEVPGEYRHVFAGQYQLQPRLITAYGRDYPYSGAVVECEEVTPASVQRLIDETNVMFGLTAETGFNMNLLNRYPTGRHYISEHSDDERHFDGHVRDVVCWITGPARREAIFSVKVISKKVPEGLRSLCVDAERPEQTRELLRVCIPAGMYVMHGDTFQVKYSHFFPKLHDKLFERIRKVCGSEHEKFKDFPRDVPKSDKGASRAPIVHAEWIKANADLIEDHIRRGTFGKNVTVELFREWCLERVSHTLRKLEKSATFLEREKKRQKSE